nr:hypothetical protein CFP56_12682 [Quercus suber]
MERGSPNSTSVNHGEAKSSGGRKINEDNATINSGSNNRGRNGGIADTHYKDLVLDVTLGSNHATIMDFTHRAVLEQKQKEIDIQLKEIDTELSKLENTGSKTSLPSNPESRASLIPPIPSQPSDSRDNQATARVPSQPSLLCILPTWTRKARPASYIESPSFEQITRKKREAATVVNHAVLPSKRALIMQDNNDEEKSCSIEDRIHSEFLPHEAKSILSLPLSSNDPKVDTIIWTGTKNGHYSTKLAYRLLSDEESAPSPSDPREHKQFCLTILISKIYRDAMEHLQGYQMMQDSPLPSPSVGSIRDLVGLVIAALLERISLPSTVEELEALACRRVVAFALEIGLYEVAFEGDSEVVFKQLNAKPPCLASYAHITEESQILASNLSFASFSPVKRSGNVVADKLAKLAKHVIEPQIWLEDIHSDATNLVTLDKFFLPI